MRLPNVTCPSQLAISRTNAGSEQGLGRRLAVCQVRLFAVKLGRHLRLRWMGDPKREPVTAAIVLYHSYN
jgi:hypothetical protein